MLAMKPAKRKTSSPFAPRKVSSNSGPAEKMETFRGAKSDNRSACSPGQESRFVELDHSIEESMISADDWRTFHLAGIINRSPTAGRVSRRNA
jgi:hypothetical protein